jgi:transcriptional regulator with XRE-family HTH domain
MVARRRRRSAVAVEAERRLHERRARIGADIKAMRMRRKWTQAELGRQAALGRLVIGRLERGEGRLDVETLERIAVALGVPLAIGFDRDLREDVADAGHLAIQEVVLRLARPAGYSREFELPTRPNEPWRSADVAFGSEEQRRAIEAECWNTFGDVGAAVRSSRRKLIEIEQLAVARWGADASAGLVWVVRDTARNRALVSRYPEVFASTFIGSSDAWVKALTTGSAPPDGPGLVWCDVASGRLHAWHRRGRRRGEGDGEGDGEGEKA